MKLEQSFEVTAPLERVWNALVDVERVAPCLPGAEVTGRNDDGSYDGTFKVKIGPTAAAYSGKLHMDEIDEGAHTATMHAQGTDRRGQGGAKATIISTVADAGNGATRVDVVTDYHITGRLARFGRGGMIEEISNRLLGEFAKSLQQMLAGDGQGAAAGAAAAGAAPAGAGAAPAETPAAEAAPAGEAETAASEAASEPAVSEAAASVTPPVAEGVAGAELGAVVPEAAPASEPAPGVTGAPPSSAAASGVTGAPPSSAAGSGVTGAPPSSEPAPVPGGTGTPVGDESPFPGATPPPTASEPIQGLSLVSSVLWGRVKRNPAPAVALVLGFLLALRVFRRRD